jgi:hypothetical protein
MMLLAKSTTGTKDAQSPAEMWSEAGFLPAEAPESAFFGIRQQCRSMASPQNVDQEGLAGLNSACSMLHLFAIMLHDTYNHVAR